MRRGLPVLVTPDVGMSEIVRDVDAGLVVAPSPDGIAAGLRSLLADPKRSRAMGELGREHVVAHYGWPSVAERMEGLYRSIVDSPARARTGG